MYGVFYQAVSSEASSTSATILPQLSIGHYEPQRPMPVANISNGVSLPRLSDRRATAARLQTTMTTTMTTTARQREHVMTRRQLENNARNTAAVLEDDVQMPLCPDGQ